MPRVIKKDSTNITDYMRLETTSGADATGVTITGLDLQYVRNGSAPSAKADATALASSGSAHTDNAMIEIDATDQPGLYRVDYPDAASAIGVPSFVFTIKGSGIRTAHKEIQLVDFDPEDSVRLGLTALPNAAADAAGGLVISDTGGLDMDAVLSGNTPQGADNNTILAHADYGLSKLVRSTTPTNTLDISATGESGLDFDNVKDATGAHTLTNITIPTVTNNSDMRGTDSAATSTKQDTMETTLNDVPTTAEFELRTLLAAAYTIVSDLGTVQSANHTVSIAAILADVTGINGEAMRGTDSANTVVPPSVAQFNARSLLSADYVVVGDTLARVTLVDTVTDNTDLVTAANVLAAMEADNTLLDYLATDLIYKKSITIASGNSIQYDKTDTLIGTIGGSYADDGTTVFRKNQTQVKV